MDWTPVLPNVFVWRDSCNVYAILGPSGTLIINAGTGQWMEHLDGLPAPPVALICTHFFRDHSAGASTAVKAGIPIYVPEGEYDIFSDPGQHFRQRHTYVIYDNYWDLFAPIEPIPIAGKLKDYERITIAGCELRVFPLPGVTLTQVGLVLEKTEAGPIVFCGEAIHSPGRLARISPLQYNYNDLSGAVNVYFSAAALRALKPSALLPSLGEPMIENCDSALSQLQTSIKALCADRPVENAMIEMEGQNALQKVSEHVYFAGGSAAHSHFIISDAGKALVIDYGYSITCGLGPIAPWYPKSYTRRPLLHSLESLKEHTGIDRVDVVLLSHFHDDHVSGVGLLQRLYGAQCWASEVFADLLEQPEAHCFPCNWPHPIYIDRRLPLNQPIQWEEYTFHLTAMSGHTRFSTLIAFEADGKRFAHTGDQYALQLDACHEADGIPRQNMVYRNGAHLDSYTSSAASLTQWRPDIVLSGHWPPVHTSEDFFQHIQIQAQRIEDLHRQIMPLNDQDAHFGLDSWMGWIWPYRTYIETPRPVEVTITVRNPLPQLAKLDVRLVGPEEWVGSAACLEAEARAEVACRLTITPSGFCRRQPFAFELWVNEQPYGQIAEALITVGGNQF